MKFQNMIIITIVWSGKIWSGEMKVRKLAKKSKKLHQNCKWKYMCEEDNNSGGGGNDAPDGSITGYFRRGSFPNYPTNSDIVVAFNGKDTAADILGSLATAGTLNLMAGKCIVDSTGPLCNGAPDCCNESPPLVKNLYIDVGGGQKLNGDPASAWTEGALVYKAITDIIAQRKIGELNIPSKPSDAVQFTDPNAHFPYSAYKTMPNWKPVGICLDVESKADPNALKDAIKEIKSAGMEVMVTVAHSGFSAGSATVMKEVFPNEDVDYLVPQVYGQSGATLDCRIVDEGALSWSEFAMLKGDKTKILAAVPTPNTVENASDCMGIPLDGIMSWPH
jgi:hypothetical protein